MSVSVELRDLSRRYGQTVHALRSVSLSVAAGEFVTLLGPSGSGKSTILKLVAGIDQPTGGEIRIGGRPVQNLPAHKRSIGMVFQNYALFPHMSVAQNIEFPLRVRELPEAEIRKRTGDAVEITRLQGLTHRFPRELSGGQQQRVALARAIVFDPQVLLMDEPLGALDRHLREELKMEIKRIHQSLGVTVLFVTHDQDEALLLSDRVVVMRDGGIEQVAPPRELYAKPCNRFVASFVGEANIIECRIDDGGLRVGNQKLPGTVPASSAKREATVMVRPELIEVDQDASRGGVTATLKDIVFLGEATRVLAEIDGVPIVAKRPSKGLATFVPGQPVHLRWAAGDMVLLES